MVGIFARFTSRSGHRRARSAIDGREGLASASDLAASGAIATATSLSSVPHGIEIATEFKPVERPSEPLDHDQPVQCPLPEPSILNDGRIWKERVSSVAQRRLDTPVIQEQSSTELDTPPRKPPTPPKRVILPSISAPENNILKLLDECNASGIQSQ